VMGTAEATINAIHDFTEARVVAKCKRSRSPRQSPPSQQPSSAKRPILIFPSAKTMPALCRELESCRRRYAQGNHVAVLEALWAWLSWCQGPPDWIVKGFLAALMKWFRGEVLTLDAAFGIKRPPGEHADVRHERDRLRPFIVFEVEALRQQKVPIRVACDRVGADIGHGGGYVKDVYYERASAEMRECLRAFRVRRVLPKT